MPTQRNVIYDRTVWPGSKYRVKQSLKFKCYTFQLCFTRYLEPGTSLNGRVRDARTRSQHPTRVLDRVSHQLFQRGPILPAPGRPGGGSGGRVSASIGAGQLGHSPCPHHTGRAACNTALHHIQTGATMPQGHPLHPRTRHHITHGQEIPVGESHKLWASMFPRREILARAAARPLTAQHITPRGDAQNPACPRHDLETTLFASAQHERGPQETYGALGGRGPNQRQTAGR